MNTSQVRAQLGAALTEVLPSGKYHIVSNVGTVDRLAKRLVQIELSSFSPSNNAKGVRTVELTIHVATHLDGTTAAAEDDAEAAAFEVFAALETFGWANPTRAEKTVYKDKYLGFDITTEILTKRN
ncbi:hypothetical protein JOF28_001964 [Leucobacter exalbidus]|uniref:DUF3168 domain-containing protein n=1 Tax=Leucobacter exalbidus TaxID=662960 RepID=A0A940T406_9MICO|nr:hypothetical protein [Leucobacter exalbidus]MBP1326732.1 hypothetical protein [Leucobacter exalbidus]